MKIWLQAYSHGNFGDDLFVYIITHRYPNCRFYIACDFISTALNNIDNLYVLKSTLQTKIFSKLITRYIPYSKVAHQCDMGVLIGGSMFIERASWKNKIAYYDNLLNILPRFCIIGSNFGPYSSSIYKKEYENLFKKFEDICFRDSTSYNLFINNTNVRFAPDIAFTLPIDKDKSPSKKDRSIVVSIVNPNHKKELSRYYNEYVVALKRICAEFIMNGYDVTLLSMCEAQGDLDCCREIAKSIKVKIVSYSHNIEDVVNLFSSAEYVVATRYHSMILGWLYSCKVFPIVYDLKMQSVLKDCSWEKPIYGINDLQKISAKDILSYSDKLEGINSAVAEAEKQFAYLDQIMGV